MPHKNKEKSTISTIDNDLIIDKFCELKLSKHEGHQLRIIAGKGKQSGTIILQRKFLNMEKKDWDYEDIAQGVYHQPNNSSGYKMCILFLPQKREILDQHLIVKIFGAFGKHVYLKEHLQQINISQAHFINEMSMSEPIKESK